MSLNADAFIYEANGKWTLLEDCDDDYSKTRAGFEGARQKLERAQQVAVTGTPSFGESPSVPKPLGRYLGERAAVLDEVAQRVCTQAQGVTWIGSTNALPMGPDFFAQDRFHPSARGYREWTRVIAGKMAL